MTTITLVTVGKRAEANRMAKVLVNEGLAACVTILPPATSVYRWKGKLCEEREHLLILKSTKRVGRRLIQRIRVLHSYDVPEIVTFAITAGNSEYLKWVEESTR